DPASAKAQLLALFREDPDARLNPAVFLPELVALAESARLHVDAERRERSRASAPPVGEATVKIEPPASARATLLQALTPFGVGQYANGEVGKGSFFLVAESAALFTAVASFTSFTLLKRSGGLCCTGEFEAQDLEL